MPRPVAPPRLVLDAQGRPRAKLKRGWGPPKGPNGPHAHYFSPEGLRVDKVGRAIEERSKESFASVLWDVDDEPVDLADPAAPNVEAALSLARRSGTLRDLLSDVMARGWVFELAAPGVKSRCDKATQTIALDATTRGAFVARMVHSIAYAHAMGTATPHIDPSAPHFTRGWALCLMRQWGQASLHRAVVRDEILVAGGPDLGGPGLRGLQLEAYDIYRRQNVPLARAIDALAFSIDGDLGATFEPGQGPLVQTSLRRAFVPPKVTRAREPDPDLLRAIERVAELPVLDSDSVSRALGVTLSPRADIVENPYVTVESAVVAAGPFSRIDLCAPAPGASHLSTRVVLAPQYEVSAFDLLRPLGPATPLHVDLFEDALASAVHERGHRRIAVTYAATEARIVRSVSVGAPSRSREEDSRRASERMRVGR